MSEKSLPIIVSLPAVVAILLLALEENVWSYSQPQFFFSPYAFGS